MQKTTVTISRKRGSEWPAFLKDLAIGEGLERVSVGEMQTIRKHAKEVGIDIAAQAVETAVKENGKTVATFMKFARVG